MHRNTKISQQFTKIVWNLFFALNVQIVVLLQIFSKQFCCNQIANTCTCSNSFEILFCRKIHIVLPEYRLYVTLKTVRLGTPSIVDVQMFVHKECIYFTTQCLFF